MFMTELNRACCFSVVLDGYFLFVLFSYLQKAHIDEGFEKNLTFHFIHSDWQLDSESLLADDFDDFSLVFEFFALVLDFGSGG